MSVGDSDIAHWQSWIGRAETREEVIEAESLRRFAAALGEDLDVERTPPSLAHWAFFLPVVPPDQIGVDGHPRRGGFLPPVSLPRRMFASGEMRFGEPLRVGAPAVRTSTIRDLRHRRGGSGELVLIDVEHVIVQDGAERVVERQTIVYRDVGGRIAAVEDKGEAVQGEVWTPGPVDLFRFSAVTFNSHRIHYDQPYVTREEGYPDLVVHGPFTAARLFGLAARREGRPAAFSFRAAAPLFVSQPVRLAAGEAPGSYRAIRCDGVTAMEAKISL
jgi:3-methylfumaryl-CoA hydratase